MRPIRVRLKLLLFFTIGSLAQSQVAKPIFKPAVVYSSGGQNASSLTTADLNRDGKLDLVVANLSSETVSVLLGNGDGTFQTAVPYGSGGASPLAVLVADVNGDGTPDLLVANECGSGVNCKSGSAGVLLGNGDGTFQTVVTYLSGSNSPLSSIAVEDINGDGKLDLLLGNQCISGDCVNGTVSVLLGNGDGTFQLPTTYISGGLGAWSMAVADVNGDGKPDLVVANGWINGVTVGVLLGNGDGSFQSPVTYGSGGTSAASVALADVNGDGKLDLLVANSSTDNVGVLLGNGDGTFQTAVSYGSGGVGPSSLALVDVNGDGNLDVVVANLARCARRFDCNGEVAVLLGNGDGTFKAAASYGSGGYRASSVAVADVNGDGTPDLLVANLFLCQQKTNCLGGNAGVLLGVPVKTTTIIRASVNPSVVNQSVTFTATTISAYGPVPDGAVISFQDGKTTIGTGITADGVASFTTSLLAAKTHIIKASYLGNPFFKASSKTLKQVVNQ